MQVIQKHKFQGAASRVCPPIAEQVQQATIDRKLMLGQGVGSGEPVGFLEARDSYKTARLEAERAE